MEKSMIGAGAEYLYGYVDGECLPITNTIEQITAFITTYSTKSVKITNVLDLMEIETSMGFIFRCSDQNFLKIQLLPHLVPVQRGEKKGEEFVPYEFEEDKDEFYVFEYQLSNGTIESVEAENIYEALEIVVRIRNIHPTTIKSIKEKI